MFPRSQSLQNNTDKKYQKKHTKVGKIHKKITRKKSENCEKITRIHKKYNEKFQRRKWQKCVIDLQYIIFLDVCKLCVLSKTGV